MYDESMIRPMREELTGAGFEELKSAQDVETIFNQQDSTALVFINSVCGCAAGVARPGILASLDNSILPKRLTTAFAGNDVEAVNRVRELCAGYPPSSPCGALVRDGQVVHMVERHNIEGQSSENVGKVLKSAFDKYCGPEIDESAEIYDPMGAIQVTVARARELVKQDSDVALLDVREPWEIEGGMIDGAIAVDRTKAQEIISDWPREREIIVYCQHGQRSLQAAQFFQSNGFQNIKSLAGGYAEWTSVS